MVCTSREAKLATNHDVLFPLPFHSATLHLSVMPFYLVPMDFLRALPGRDLVTLLRLPPPAFILLASKPLRSPELLASPDLEWRFLPPKPNFSFFFARLWLVPPAAWPRPAPERWLCLPISCSTPTSKRSASLVPRSPPPDS